MNQKIIFYNGRIWTGDQNYPEAEAMVIEHGRIAAVGTNQELINQVIGCEKIDLAGTRVIPGLHDSHQHLVNIGRMMDWVNLNGSASRAEVVARCRTYAAANPARNIITGRGFLHDSFDDRAMPTRYDLDQVSENKPVVIVRACGHIAVVNSAMLRLAGIGHGYQFGSDGQVDLDANGEPLGIFRESAISLVSAFYPKDTTADVQRYISNAAKAVTASGLTSVQTNDVGNTGNEGWETCLFAYADWIKANPAGLRVNHQLLFAKVETLLSFHAWRQFNDLAVDAERMSYGPLKIMCDGSLGGRTAHMLAPYTDDPTTCGVETLTQDEKISILSLGHALGYQMSGHAIGDAAIQGMLNAFEKTLGANPTGDARPRIIHAQFTTPAQLKQIKRLGVVIDAQPGFVGTDLHVVEERIGKARASTSYIWKTMLDMEIPVAGGSDSPVEPFNPFIGIGCAVTRQDPAGFPPGGWLPEQRILVEQAVRMYTYGSAYSCFQEKVKGRLMKNMLADFILLDRDIFSIEANEIQDTKVLQTWIDGKLV